MPVTQRLHTWLAKQWRRRGIWAYLTWPLSWLYGRIAQHRQRGYETGRQPPYRAAVPVIVVGNIYVGGTGKTPLTCALADVLRALGFTPGLVSRGYGRNPSALPMTGSGQALDWQQYGDEPALIARKTAMPVSVHSNRSLALEHLLKDYPDVDVVLSDDGLQHYGLARDFEILIQDERGVGNGWLLPAGPLREPPSRLKSVDLVFERRASLDQTKDAQPRFCVDLARWRHAASGKLIAANELAHQSTLKRPVLAAAAIGVPARFFESIAQLGISIDQALPLPDHQPIDPAWFEQQSAGTILLTEKDAIKLPSIQDPRVWIAETTVHWWHHDIGTFLNHKLAQAGIAQPG